MIFYLNNIDNENDCLKVENCLFDRSRTRKGYALLTLINIDMSLFFKLLNEKDWNDINTFKIEFDDNTSHIIKFTRLECINIEDSNSNTVNLILFI